MSNTDFLGFCCVTEDRTRHVGELAGEIARDFSQNGLEFGSGVKRVTITLILTDPGSVGASHKPEPPKFMPGLQRFAGTGLIIELEDILEFTIRPDLGSVLNAHDKSEVASAIGAGLMDVYAELSDLGIADFDMKAFLSEFSLFLANT